MGCHLSPNFFYDNGRLLFCLYTLFNAAGKKLWQEAEATIVWNLAKLYKKKAPKERERKRNNRQVPNHCCFQYISLVGRSEAYTNHWSSYLPLKFQFSISLNCATTTGKKPFVQMHWYAHETSFANLDEYMSEPLIYGERTVLIWTSVGWFMVPHLYSQTMMFGEKTPCLH